MIQGVLDLASRDLMASTLQEVLGIAQGMLSFGNRPAALAGWRFEAQEHQGGS